MGAGQRLKPRVIASSDRIRDMRKLCIIAAMIMLGCAAGFAQIDTSNDSAEQMAHLAVSPQRDGIGRAIVEVLDENGRPIDRAGITLESKWGDNEFCESFGPTNTKGAIALPSIHMGDLRLIVKAKGYETVKMPVTLAELARPIRVNLKKKG
jgi:hypothetical protein